MHVTEIYYDTIDWRQFPFGLTDWTYDCALKADKDRTPQQREQFKQEVMRALQADRLMVAQQVEVFIVGVAAHYLTPWGGPPVTGQAFEEDAIEVLIAAGNGGDPFVVHVLAYETGQRAMRQLLQQTTILQPLAPGSQPRRLTRAEVEAVVADKDAVVQAALEHRSRTHIERASFQIKHQQNESGTMPPLVFPDRR